MGYSLLYIITNIGDLEDYHFIGNVGKYVVNGNAKTFSFPFDGCFRCYYEVLSLELYRRMSRKQFGARLGQFAMLLAA